MTDETESQRLDREAASAVHMVITGVLIIMAVVFGWAMGDTTRDFNCECRSEQP